MSKKMNDRFPGNDTEPSVVEHGSSFRKPKADAPSSRYVTVLFGDWADPEQEHDFESRVKATFTGSIDRNVLLYVVPAGNMLAVTAKVMYGGEPAVSITQYQWVDAKQADINGYVGTGGYWSIVRRDQLV